MNRDTYLTISNAFVKHLTDEDPVTAASTARWAILN
jgi:hypothetical protein